MEALARQVRVALLIDVCDREVVQRLSSRRVRVDAVTTTTSSLTRQNAKAFLIRDASLLVQKDDDKPHVVEHRLAVYYEKLDRSSDPFTIGGCAARDQWHTSSRRGLPPNLQRHLGATAKDRRHSELSANSEVPE